MDEKNLTAQLCLSGLIGRFYSRPCSWASPHFELDAGAKRDAVVGAPKSVSPPIHFAARRL